MKKPKKLDENFLSDAFHSVMPERKYRETASEESEELEDDEYYKQLEQKKHARFEALKKKSEGY